MSQKFEDEVLSYENKKSFSDIGRGDVILSRSNRIRVAFQVSLDIANSKPNQRGFLASFQAGKFGDSLIMCMAHMYTNLFLR